MMDSYLLRNANVDKMDNLYQSMRKRKLNLDYSSDYIEMVQNTTNFNCCMHGDKLSPIKRVPKKKKVHESPKAPPEETPGGAAKKSKCSGHHGPGHDHVHPNELQSIRRGRMP